MPSHKPIADLLSPHALSRVDRFSLLARTAVEGFISGLHRSLYHGFGSEFFQYRGYVPGDDLKYIDWKVYGKRDRFYTKVFQEETNMNCCFLLDASSSMAYRGTRAPCTKLRYASMIVACLAYLANRQGDNVGLYVYGNDLQAALPPSGRAGGLNRILTELHRATPAGEANHAKAAGYAAENLRRRGMVVMVSDFHGAEAELRRMIKRFRFARHDCILLQVLDRDELDLPFGGSVRFVDSESEAEMATAPDAIRERYSRDMTEFVDAIRTDCLAEQADYLLLRTDENLGNTLAAYLHRREALHGC